MSSLTEIIAETRNLAEAALSGDLDDVQNSRLEDLLLRDARARREYVQYMATIGSMRRNLGGLASISLTQPPGSRLESSGRLRKALVAVAALVMATVAGFSWWLGQRIDPPGAVPLSPVALLQEDGNCVWEGPTGRIVAGETFRPGQNLKLIRGTAKFRFDKGATVAVEGPSSFEILSSISLRLHEGTVVVRANGPEKNFVVETSDASIVDLGTSFGVHCENSRATEVEVFEGAVTIRSDQQPATDQVLGLGASARIHRGGEQLTISPLASVDDRFGDLLEHLWDDLRVVARDEAGLDARDFVEASFSDPPIPGQVDTFEGASRGRGWLTPWIASGNPSGEIRTRDSLGAEGSSYLQLGFNSPHARTVAREYGRHGRFDPMLPHVISWRWRLDEVPERFVRHFADRIHFYGNPYYRRNSWPTNSWLVGVVGGHETANDQRQVYPNHWYVFDGRRGDVFERDNMIDTGMTLKAGVVYRFSVTVYPEQAMYDISISDDEQTYTRGGLRFRNQSPVPANVLHFGLCTSEKNEKTPFSLGAIRIEPLESRVSLH